MEQILESPIILLVIIVLAAIISKALKLAKKIIGFIICLVIAGWLVLYFL